MEDQNNLNPEQKADQNYQQEPIQVLSENHLKRKERIWDLLAKNKKLVLVIILVSLGLSILIGLLITRKNFKKNEASSAEEAETKPEEQLSPTPSEELQPTPTVTRKTTYSPSSVTVIPTATPIPLPTNTPTPIPTATPIPAPPDTTPPVFKQFTGPADGGVYDYKNFCFPMYLTDNAPGEIQVRYKFDNGDWVGWGTDFAPCYNNVESGVHQFSAQGRDAAGNETEIITRTFTIQAE